MSIQILMPALSPTMEEGTLAKWLVKEGDEVRSGDILAEIETDKATMEFEAIDEGRIAKILVPEGAEGVKVNAPIAELAQDGDAAPMRKTEAKDRAKDGKGGAPTKLPIPESVKTASAPQKIPAAPRANGSVAHDSDVPAGTEFVTMTV